MTSKPPADLDDRQICLGYDEAADFRDGAMMPPIVQTSLFAHERFEDLLSGLASEHENFVYSRGQNPTVQALEQKLALLERGESCKCFGSGMGAVSAVLTGLLDGGDHVVFGNHIYGPTLQLAERLTRYGVEHTVVTQSDTDNILAAIQPNTRLLYLESPGSMLFQELDLKTLTERAHQRGVLVAVDNSWASPLFQKPLTLGADISLHSCTKYIGGHSDVVAGAVICEQALMQRIYYNAFMLNGAIMAPFEAWLLIRSLRTLPVRMQQHQAGALAVARFLAEHPRVKAVHHPGLNPVSYSALTGTSGLFSFEADFADFAALFKFIDGLKYFQSGVSWGGVESLVISPSRPKDQSKPSPLVRLSVGLEDPDLLIADLTAGLAK